MSSNATETDTQVKTDRFSKDVPWYEKEVQHFSPAGRELLEKYSHIPPDEVDAHVHEIVRLAGSLRDSRPKLT